MQSQSLPYDLNNKWYPKQSSEEKCQQRLLQTLLELKKQNVLRRCLRLESNEFEVLEFYGDAYLYERVSYFIMTTRRFMDPNLMTKLRTSCIKNANLALVFEQLKLFELLLEPAPVDLLLKTKADILEAIIGELAEDGSSGSEDLLSALIAYIAYMGEKEYFQENSSVSPNIESMSPNVTKKNKPRRRQRSRKGSVNNPNPLHNFGGNRHFDHKQFTNNPQSPLSNPSQKQPLFILTTPSNHSLNPNPAIKPVVQPPQATIPQPPSKVTRSESLPVTRNRLPFISASNNNPSANTSANTSANMVSESSTVTTNGSRNIFIHKITELSTSSESSSGSNSLSSSPLNLLFLPTQNVKMAKMSSESRAIEVKKV